MDAVKKTPQTATKDIDLTLINGDFLFFAWPLIFFFNDSNFLKQNYQTVLITY